MAFMRNPIYIIMQDGFVSIVDPDSKSGSSAQHFNFTQELFDEIVMMRYYNMTNAERMDAVDRVLKNQFETGADGLRKASGLPTVMERVDEEVERQRTAAHGGSV